MAAWRCWAVVFAVAAVGCAKPRTVLNVPAVPYINGQILLSRDVPDDTWICVQSDFISTENELMSGEGVIPTCVTVRELRKHARIWKEM